jgi:hypothetical protein
MKAIFAPIAGAVGPASAHLSPAEAVVLVRVLIQGGNPVVLAAEPAATPGGQ